MAQKVTAEEQGITGLLPELTQMAKTMQSMVIKHEQTDIKVTKIDMDHLIIPLRVINGFGKSSVDRAIGSLERIESIKEEKFFRHYNPETKTITFYKDPYELEDIKKEIQGIQRKVKQNPLFPLTKRDLKRR